MVDDDRGAPDASMTDQRAPDPAGVVPQVPMLDAT